MMRNEDMKIDMTINCAGFFQLLTLLFIALKLTGYISWSWWLVLLPVWGSIAIFLVAIMIVVVIALISVCLDAAKEKVAASGK